MPSLQIVSAEPLAGKTTVAVGLARGFREAESGPIQLVRAGSDSAADRDARTFASLGFVTAADVPVAPSRVPRPARGGLLIVEAGEQPLAALPAIVVVRGSGSEADRTLARELGDRLVGTIATVVPPQEIEATARDLTNAGLRPLALLPENSTLAAPAIAEIRSALAAELLHDGENETEPVESLLVAPIYTDGARPHFQRFASKAVLTPFYKTDLLLAAIESGAACLVITGGQPPSLYVIDRVRDEETTILLSGEGTVTTVNALSEVWTRSPFGGERKVEAVWSLLRDRLDFASLLRKL